MKKLFLTWLIALGLYTFDDLKNVECKTYCKTSVGYDSGVYTNGACWCANKINEEKLADKKILLPNKKAVKNWKIPEERFW